MNTQLGHLPAKAQLPKAQPSVLSPISNQSHGTAAVSEICSQSRKSVAFWCGKHRPAGEPFNRAGLGRKNHDVRDAPAAFAGSRLERPITPWARISVIISRSPDGDKYRLGALAVDSRGVPARDALAERFTSRYHGCPPRWRCHRAASRAHCVRNSSLQQRFTAGRLPRYLPSCSGQMRGLRRSSPLSPRPQALPSPG